MEWEFERKKIYHQFSSREKLQNTWEGASPINVAASRMQLKCIQFQHLHNLPHRDRRVIFSQLPPVHGQLTENIEETRRTEWIVRPQPTVEKDLQ